MERGAARCSSLARRTRTIKMCSFDARSKGQPRPLPLSEVLRSRKVLVAAALTAFLSIQLTDIWPLRRGLVPQYTQATV